MQAILETMTEAPFTEYKMEPSVPLFWSWMQQNPWVRPCWPALTADKWLGTREQRLGFTWGHALLSAHHMVRRNAIRAFPGLVSARPRKEKEDHLLDTGQSKINQPDSHICPVAWGKTKLALLSCSCLEPETLSQVLIYGQKKWQSKGSKVFTQQESTAAASGKPKLTCALDSPEPSTPARGKAWGSLWPYVNKADGSTGFQWKAEPHTEP
jgi:hypothetical protein